MSDDENWPDDILSDFNKLKTDEQRLAFFEVNKPDERHKAIYQRLISEDASEKNLDPVESPDNVQRSKWHIPAEFKTLGFWLTLLGVIIGVASLIR
ncbi:MAG: hypothetical protein ACI4DY_08420 [Monoglobaceae bacterium]